MNELKTNRRKRTSDGSRTIREGFLLAPCVSAHTAPLHPATRAVVGGNCRKRYQLEKIMRVGPRIENAPKPVNHPLFSLNQGNIHLHLFDYLSVYGLHRVACRTRTSTEGSQLSTTQRSIDVTETRE